MLQQLLAADLFSLLLVFARVGAAISVLPGIGEVFVAPRIRLLLAAALTVVIVPVITPGLPPLPAGPLKLFVLLGGEVVIGLLLGVLARFLMATLHVAGTIIGFQTSLANATLFDPANSQQGSLVGGFLSLLGLLLIFSADLHHAMLMAIADSYTLFVPGQPLPLADFSETGARTVARSFDLALQISAPFLVIGLIFNLGLGLLNRLMPQIQVFFIALPLQIVMAFSMVALTLSGGLLWFLTHFQAALQDTFVRG